MAKDEILDFANNLKNDDNYTLLNIPLKDDWMEPTDGTIELTAKDYKKKTYTSNRKAYITKDGKIKK